MEMITEFEDEEVDLGITPLGMLLVVCLGVIGLIFYLDPKATLYDIRIGGMIGLSIAIAFSPRGLYRWSNEGDLPKTFLLALIGAAIVSIVVTITNTLPLSSLEGPAILIRAIPTIFEELIFRVGVFLAVREVAGPIVATLTQAGLFSLYHFIVWSVDIQYAIVLFIGAIIFQVIFILSQNILSSMMAHAIVNLRPYLLIILLSPLMVLTVAGGLLIALWRRSRNG